MKKRAPTVMGQRPVLGDCRDARPCVSTGGAYTWNVYLLFPFAQLLIPLVPQFRELLGLGEELLGFGREIRTAFKPRLGQFFTTVSFHQRLCFVSKLFS